MSRTPLCFAVAKKRKRKLYKERASRSDTLHLFSVPAEWLRQSSPRVLPIAV